MLIKVRICMSYGRRIIRPVCAKAETFAKLTGQKTLTQSDIELIKSLGFTVEVVRSEPETL